MASPSVAGVLVTPSAPVSGTVLEVSSRPDAVRLVRIEGSRAAARSRVKLSLVDLPVLPHELAELLPDDVRRRLDAEDPG